MLERRELYEFGCKFVCRLEGIGRLRLKGIERPRYLVAAQNNREALPSLIDLVVIHLRGTVLVLRRKRRSGALGRTVRTKPIDGSVVGERVVRPDRILCQNDIRVVRSPVGAR